MQGRGTIKERKTEQNIGSGMKIKKAYMKEGKKLNEGKIMEATRNERERMFVPFGAPQHASLRQREIGEHRPEGLRHANTSAVQSLL